MSPLGEHSQGVLYHSSVQSKKKANPKPKNKFWGHHIDDLSHQEDLDEGKMTCLLSRVFLLDVGTVQYLLSRYTTLQYTILRYTTLHMGAPAPDPGFGTWAIRDETSPRGEGVWGDLGILVPSSIVADQEKEGRRRKDN